MVAERQGKTAARNILGHRERFDAVPFFWTEQYDFGLAYVGHAARWDQADVVGSLEKRNCTITYSHNGKKLAVALVGRDREGLRVEIEFERALGRKASQTQFRSSHFVNARYSRNLHAEQFHEWQNPR